MNSILHCSLAVQALTVDWLEAGQQVTAGERLAQVIDDAVMTLIIVVDQQDIARIIPGLQAEVSFSHVLLPFSGSVQRVGTAASSGTVALFPVEISAANPGLLRSGMQVSACILDGNVPVDQW